MTAKAFSPGRPSRRVPTLRGPQWILRPGVLGLVVTLALLVTARRANSTAAVGLFLGLALALGLATGLRAWRRRRG